MRRIEPNQALRAAREQLFGKPEIYSDPNDELALSLFEGEPTTRALQDALERAPNHPGIQWLAYVKAPHLFFELSDAKASIERVRRLQASIGEQVATLRHLSAQSKYPEEARRRAHELLCDIVPYDPTLVLHRVRFLRDYGTKLEWHEALSRAVNNEMFAGHDIFFEALLD